MAIKTEMSKTYDRVEWPFVQAIAKIGFFRYMGFQVDDMNIIGVV